MCTLLQNQMEIEKIKLLRSRISIPLNVSIELLKKYNGNVLVCEQEFHNDNIKTICRLSECDEEIAKKYYLKYDYDIKKAIERINQRPVCIITKTPNKIINKIGFSLWAENATLDKYKTSKNDTVFIPTDDFEYIIEKFKAVFPLKHPYHERTEDGFDIYGTNYFDNATCRQIIENIGKMKNDNPYIEEFLREVIKWFNDKLRYADCIVVFGNL